MANQGADRREVLEMLAKAAVASQFPGFSRWVFGQQHNHADAAPPARQPNYQPSYFSPAEYRTIDALTALIIPKDDTPGAQEAGVSEFIDFMAAHGEKEVQQPMRDGLKWLDTAGQTTFLKLSPDQQTEILKRAAVRGADGHDFFRLIRRYTVMGYYTSAVGMKELDFPGLKMYSASPSCPHINDPEHLHLPAPRF
ncbi:MAG TPA: gluconate 2-dehydrogenase subunit 3 family protein [Bryobacteraceae bacterium]|nr:gluconate 2-dehydrogenase subunit 3 family protein [Bryobacteraceae bacterium]